MLVLIAANKKGSPRVALWLLAGVFVVFLLASMLFLTPPLRDSPFSNDARFVLTTKPQFGTAAGAPLKDRVFVWAMRIHQRFAKPKPGAFTFPPAATNRCSIHGTLNQCMDVTGVRYVIARDVAAGTVEFGHPNTLNGDQWVKAFTEALETGQPEWWDSKAGRFRKEKLILLTNSPATVLVLPQETAREFQRSRE
jgi:hypothetical protein